MGCKTHTVGRVINEKCDVCEHSLHWHNVIHGHDMPEGGWPCLACNWERRIQALEWADECREFGCNDEH